MDGGAVRDVQPGEEEGQQVARIVELHVELIAAAVPVRVFFRILEEDRQLAVQGHGLDRVDKRGQRFRADIGCVGEIGLEVDAVDFVVGVGADRDAADFVGPGVVLQDEILDGDVAEQFLPPDGQQVGVHRKGGLGDRARVEAEGV